VSDLPLLCITLTSLMSGVRPFIVVVVVVVTGEWSLWLRTPELTMRRPPPGVNVEIQFFSFVT
jgi:hypothetical protein